MTSRGEAGQNSPTGNRGQAFTTDMQSGTQGGGLGHGQIHRQGAQRDGDGGGGGGQHDLLGRRPLPTLPHPLLPPPGGHPGPLYPPTMPGPPPYAAPQFQRPFLIPPAPPPPQGPPAVPLLSPLPCQACRKARVYCDKTQPCERCRRLKLECLPQLKSRGRKVVVPTVPAPEAAIAGRGGGQAGERPTGPKNMPVMVSVPAPPKQAVQPSLVRPANVEAPFVPVASREEGLGGGVPLPVGPGGPVAVLGGLGGVAGEGKRSRFLSPSPPSSPEEATDDVIMGASLVQALGRRAHVSSGAPLVQSTGGAREVDILERAQEEKAEARQHGKRRHGRGRVRGRGGRPSPGRQGEENLAQEVWREREEEANSVRGLGGEGCLLMSQGGMLEGGLTWSEMCCRAILRLRTRGLIDQAKLHFIRVHASLFRLTDTPGGRELLRVMADPDGLPDKQGPPLHCLGAPLPSTPPMHPASRGGPSVPPRVYTQHEEVKQDDETAPGSVSAGLRWAEEVLRTPHTYTLGFYMRSSHAGDALEIALVCNEGMERDIASASDLRSISEQARILSVFTPAWLISRRTLYSFCIGMVTAMFGRDHTLEHHGVVKLVRRDGKAVRCLCTQRSFQGPDDGVCRLLAVRFWPLANLFDFRLSAGSAGGPSTHIPPMIALRAAEAEEQRQRDEEGEGNEDGEGRPGREGEGEGKSDGRRREPNQGTGRWVEA